MADHVLNNFSSGVVSPKLGGRYDLGIYHSGVNTLENFLPMLQGGITRRPGTVSVGEVASGSRLIPFVISENISFILELSHEQLRVWQNGVLWEDSGVPQVWSAPWNGIDIPKIQFTQDYEKLYLVHRNMPPQVMFYTGGSLIFGTMTFDCDPSGPYANLFIGEGNYPGCVAYCSNRLWFASSDNRPYRLWASRPFETTNFETFDEIVSVTDTIKSPDQWPANWHEDPESIVVAQSTTRNITTATNAMVLEVGSNRNDRIEWLCAGRNILVGTASSEWIIPGTIDAINLSIVQSSTYGSTSIQGLSVNEDLIFIQSGGKRCRSYVFTSDGYHSPDLTYSADHVLSTGVKEMHFQRIPEPRVYMVLNNGDIAVLSYNKLYDMQAWSVWTFEGEAKSACVLDAPGGQEVYVYIERSGNHYLEKFDEASVVHADRQNETPVGFDSIMITNRLDMPLEASSSIGRRKRVSTVVFRLLNSGGYQVGYNRLESYKNPIEEGDHRIIVGGGYEKELKIQARSIDDEPLTILAMVLGLEVG